MTRRRLKSKLVADTVNKQIYEIIKGMIHERKLRPGERIDPKAIAGEHGVSLMPVRDALQQLTTQGLVVTVQRVGFFVAKFTNAQLLQIHDTRKMFEFYCIQQYFDNIDRQEARLLLERFEKAPLDNSKALKALDITFHHMLVAASHNEFLLAQYNHLNALFNLSMGPFSAEIWEEAVEEHKAVLRAICEGDRERAYRCLVIHLERVCSELSAQHALLEQEGS